MKVLPIPGSATIVQTVLSGRLDIGATTPEPLLEMYQNGNSDIVMVYDFIRRPTGSIAVLDESPIRKLEDFRGKRLGAQSLASSNILLTNAVLSKVGINPKTELSYLSVGVGAQALQALRGGNVDGLAIFDSVYAQMEAMGAKLRYFSGPDQDKLFAVQFIARKSVVENDPALIKGVGRALAKATYFAQQNPEACVRMMWAEVPASRIASVPEQEQLKTELAILQRRLTLLITPDSDAHGFGYYSQADLDAWNDFAVEGGLIRKKIDLSAHVTDAFVPAFNDFDHAELARKAKAWHDN